ncbi:MAG: hypothetical protein OXC14_00010 [Rhodospirillaceae bacterium]|nr:hypothetical protein [Rhodospirillaceae bacterium]
MPSKKTTIVLGAGASAEASLPTGAKLKKNIAASLNFAFENLRQTSGDPTIRMALNYEPQVDLCFQAAEKICRALPQASSIDEYLENHRGDKEIERCGKLAIVKSILEAEKDSLMYIRPESISREINFSSIENTWFNRFWQQLTRGCQENDLKERFSSIVLIIFNYDRCLEHYLYRSIQNYYGLPADVAASLVNSIEIFHPYGTVGSLPWNGGPAQVGFGAEPTWGDLRMLATQIKTFTEGTDPHESDVVTIRRHVADADRLIFLGFAYHQQNINLLKGSREDRSNTSARCYGTAHGISDNDLPVIEDELNKIYVDKIPREMTIGKLTCHELFEQYSRKLSFV